MSRSQFKSMGRRFAVTATASLAFALSLSVSHQAMAACVASGTAGTVIDCSGDSELSTPVSIVNGSTTPQIGVRLTTDGTELENETTITSQITTPTGRNTFAVFGIATTDIDDSEWTIKNEGSITAVHNGVGQLAAIGILGDAGEVSVVNEGTLSITRGPITLATNTAASLTATSPGGTGTLSNAAAIWIQEEENESLAVENEDGGVISANGKLTAGIFTRGAFLSVENEEGGVISATGDGSIAIGAHNGTDQEDEDGVHKYFIGNTVIVNEGEVSATGAGSAAIQIVDGNGLRWAASRLTDTGSGYDAGIASLNQLGRRDSTIINSGEITGNIYLGAGNHVFVNTAEGQVTGNLDVDQRRDFNYSVNNPSSLPLQVFRAGEGPAEGDDDDDDDEGAPSRVFNSVSDFLAAIPDHHFEFDNAAPFIGNVTVHTNVTGTTGAPSTVELRPHITGSGAGSTLATPSLNSGYIDGTLAIGNDGGTNGPNVTTSTIAATTTLAPVIDHVVHNGETFLVARHLLGTDLPEMGEGTALVDWSAYQVGGSVSGNALAIEASVADASTIDGISKPGAATINALIATDGSDDALNDLAVGVQNLTDEDDVRKAGEQLKPETNFATQQAAITLNQVIGQHIDERLATVGATGSAGSYAQPYGLGMGKSDPNRSSLGGPGSSIDPGIPGSGALWGRAFGVGLNQEEIDSVDGYDTTIYGALAGYDNWLAPGVRAGVAIGYAHTNIDGKGDTAQNSTEVDSYLAELYATYKGAGWYATGRAGYTWHDYDTRRVLIVPVDDVANGSHDGNQYNAALEIGAPVRTAGVVLTPVASLTYSHLDQDGYTETSSGGMALSIGDQDNDSLVSGLGLKALVPIAHDTVLEGRALWLHEFSDTAQVVGASFAAGGATFTAAGPDVGRDSAALGVGLLASVGAESTFQLNYDANIRDDFIAHIGSGELKIRY